MPRQSAANTSIGMRIDAPASWARAAAAERGSPRNAMPNARVNPTAAKPPIKASAINTTMPAKGKEPSRSTDLNAPT